MGNLEDLKRLMRYNDYQNDPVGGTGTADGRSWSANKRKRLLSPDVIWEFHVVTLPGGLFPSLANLRRLTLLRVLSATCLCHSSLTSAVPNLPAHAQQHVLPLCLLSQFRRQP